MLLTAGLGLMVGIPLGVLIDRGGFCMHSGLRKILRGEPSSSFLAYLLALGLQLFFVNALAEGQLLIVPVPPLTWLAAITGGVTFGYGMVWAKG
ncbi:MAG: YeeE/YedE family protein [Deltaproteobacteria bacterium]|nr:YeeE/YedE family protein [Deltaproteobacteria bacterium]